MKVLLVQSYLGKYDPEGAVFPIGLCYIATALKSHEVRIFDPNLSMAAFDELRDILSSFKPDVAGISLRNIDTTQKRDLLYYFKDFQPTVKLIKEVTPSVKVMAGGTGFSMFASKIMERVPEVDFGIYLEGDESAPELLNNLDRPESVKGIFIRKGDRVIFTGVRPLPDLESLPMPKRDIVDITKYNNPVYTNIGIQTKRGCPLKCAYCSYPFLNGKRVRVRSSVQVVDEIEHLISLGIRRFMFADSVFNIPERHAEEICKEIIRRKLNVTWNAWFDVKGFSGELLDLAIKAGCKSFSFSPDAASDSSLKALGKSIKEEDITRTIGLLKKAKGVRVEFNFFCTPPGQDFSGFVKTLLLYLKVNLYFMGRCAVFMGWIRIEPETRIHQIAIEDGVIAKETELLPADERGLQGLFYSCPKVRWYADPVFNSILFLQDRLKPFIKRMLRRKRLNISMPVESYGG